MIFRVFYGEPVPEARELEAGHLHHAEVHATRRPASTRTPTSASPGPSTTSPSARCRCRWRWASLAVARDRSPASLQIPAVDRRDRQLPRARRSPTRRTTSRNPATAASVRPGRSARCIGLAGIALAYRIWVRAAGHVGARCASASGPCYQLPRAQVVLRRAARRAVRAAVRLASGRFAQRDVRARRSSTDAIVGGTTGLVRAGSAAVRAAQTGFLRSYAALLVLGVGGVGPLLPAPELDR